MNKEIVLKELHSISDFIRYAASLFNQHQLYFGHGNTNAIDEAAYLILHTLNLSSDLSSVYFSASLLTEEKQKLIEIIQKRIETRQPAAYLTQEVVFAGLNFYVDERVIIPRSPIAELIENRFSPWVDENEVYNILDLCCGSGCIAIACAYAFPQADVDAIDISAQALEVAGINIERHQANNNIHLIQSDLFNSLESEEDSAFLYKYDIIVSNPPYVDQEDMDNLPEEYQAEPELALAAGDDGLGLVIPILQQAKKFLSENGILIVEVGNSQYALADTFPQVPFYWLEFERGGQGVFLLTAEQLNTYF